MYARISEILPSMERKQEFLKLVRSEVTPILKKQPGFLEILSFVPEIEGEKIIVVTLWAEKRDAERYVRDIFPRVVALVKGYLLSPITWRHYAVETSLCPHFMQALAA